MEILPIANKTHNYLGFAHKEKKYNEQYKKRTTCPSIYVSSPPRPLTLCATIIMGRVPSQLRGRFGAGAPRGGTAQTNDPTQQFPQVQRKRRRGGRPRDQLFFKNLNLSKKKFKHIRLFSYI